MENQAMTAEDFVQWMAVMGFRTDALAAKALGVSVETIADWRNGRRRNGKLAVIDTRTAYACAALAAGLLPWPRR